MENNKSYRIHTNVNQDKVLNVNLNQDFDFLEVLSIKIGQENLYKLHTSNYGVIVGRVIVNGGVGVPNAKISIFIEKGEYVTENVIVKNLYPYNNTTTLNNENIRYNLLSEEKINNCHQNVGTFPSKRMVLDDNNILETFDNYYKYTCTTNNSGDYMLFGIPVGNQLLHIDVDLSDIGFLSQSPRDFIYKGYNADLFESPVQFKKDKNLNSLVHILSQDNSVFVQPFWGDETYSNNIAITRNDINLNYKIEPTCIFMGSVVTDGTSTGVSKNCIPSKKMGRMDELITSSGTIEMIRKTIDDDVEYYSVKGNNLIDSNGVWCYQIPMNLDYITTDEYGNIVPTNDPNIGIPTRSRVRFRIGLNQNTKKSGSYETSKILVPHNPQINEDIDYEFGKTTKDDEFATKSFRDLLWNNVYTVKSYIPRLQYLNTDLIERFSGIKNTNINNGNNPIPYNNMRVKMPFLYTVVCALVKAFVFLVGSVNVVINTINEIINNLKEWGFDMTNFSYVYIPSGLCPQLDGWYFIPQGTVGSSAWTRTENKITTKFAEDTESIDNNNESSTICLTSNTDYLIQCMETSLGEEYEVIKFDFYNDWINGLLYTPKWLKRTRSKKRYLFGLINITSKTEGCFNGGSGAWSNRRFTQQCALDYEKPNGSKYYTNVVTSIGCTDKDEESKQRCHKKPGRKSVYVFGKNEGLLNRHNRDYDEYGNYLYYYRPCDTTNDGKFAKLFATDIVLLGNLDECNINGIPSIIKDLTPTSYQLPTSLALTNMEDTGYMYNNTSTSDNTTTECKLNRNGGSNDNFGTYMSIEGEDSIQLDSIPMTEMSGIDWGYAGPEQFIKIDEKEVSSSFKDLYYPGGHFLGMSCGIAQTNIKSCVNLYRACEQGVSLSQRETINSNGSDGYNEFYITPTGLISGDEINDSEFRSTFATLNFNNLKTKRDNNGYLKYDFEQLIPTNFNGELQNKVLNKSYFADGVSKNILKEKGINIEIDNAIIYPIFNDYTEENGYVIDRTNFFIIFEDKFPNDILKCNIEYPVYSDSDISGNTKQTELIDINKIQCNLKTVKIYLNANIKNPNCLIETLYKYEKDKKVLIPVEYSSKRYKVKGRVRFEYTVSLLCQNGINEEDISEIVKGKFFNKEGKKDEDYYYSIEVKDDNRYHCIFATYGAQNPNNEKNGILSSFEYMWEYFRNTNNDNNTPLFSMFCGSIYFNKCILSENVDDKTYGVYKIAVHSIRRALESPSDDYYRFRFGLNKNSIQLNGSEDNLISKKYLINKKSDKGELKSLPVYENSYYFYFGLKEGNTALDMLKRQFFSVCPNEYMPVEPSYTSTEGNNGNVTITTHNLQLPLSFELLNSNGENILEKTLTFKYLKGYYMYSDDGGDLYLTNGRTVKSNKIYILNNTYENKDSTYEYAVSLDGETIVNNNVIFRYNTGNGNYDCLGIRKKDELSNYRPPYLYTHPDSSDYNIIRENGNNVYIRYANINGIPTQWNSNKIDLQNLKNGEYKLVIKGSNNFYLDININMLNDSDNEGDNQQSSYTTILNDKFEIYYKADSPQTYFSVNSVHFYENSTAVVTNHEFDNDEGIGVVVFNGIKPSESEIKEKYHDLNIEILK